MPEFWYDYVKPKYREKFKLCNMDADGFVICLKTEDICSDIAKNDTRFDTTTLWIR